MSGWLQAVDCEVLDTTNHNPATNYGLGIIPSHSDETMCTGLAIQSQSVCMGKWLMQYPNTHFQYMACTRVKLPLSSLNK